MKIKLKCLIVVVIRNILFDNILYILLLFKEIKDNN